MSFWTKIRDAVESIGSVAGNYLLPGSGAITSHLVSSGAQQQLGSTLGQLAMLGTGVAGGAAGNLANYGQALQSMGVNTSGLGSALPSNVSTAFGLGGADTSLAQAGLPVGQQASQQAARGILGWGSPLNLLQIGSGLYGIAAGQQQQALARQAAERFQMPTADVTQLPGYQAGLEAVQRSLAAQGYQGSGNMMAALQNYGQNAYQQAVQNYMQGQQLAGGLTSQGTGLTGQGLASLGQAALFASQPIMQRPTNQDVQAGLL